MHVRRRRQLAAVIAALFAAQGALAQQQEQVLPEVKVRATAPESPVGPDEGYEVKRSASSTKTDTPLIETPQSVTVVTRERIEDQGATNLQDALNYAAGVRSDAYGLDSRTDSMRIRGAYPTEYLDGLRRQLGGFYTSNTRVDPYTLERIEVLRGPSSMLYGQGTTGGVINMVSKRPLAETQREIGVQLGSYNRKQLQTDLTGPLTADGEWLYRLAALARESDTQVDFVPDDRQLLAPTLTWRPSGRTTLTLHALWQKDESGSTLQFFPWEGTVLPNPNGQIPTNRFIGQPGQDRYDSQRAEAGWIFEHLIDERWTVRQSARATRNEVDYVTLFADSFSNPGDSYLDPARRVLGRFGYFEHREVETFSTDQHLEGRLSTGAVKHTFLLGLDTARHEDDAQVATDSPAGQGGTVPNIDVFSPSYPAYTPPPLAAQPRTTLSHTGVYLQDQMKLGRWIAVLGARRDDVKNRLAGEPDESSSATSRRAGIMYRLAGGFVPYLSYSESFTPVASTDLSGNRFKPLEGEQLETGVKWESADGRLAFNAAYYDLEEKNHLAPDPSNPLNTVQTGETRTHGMEFELVGRVLPRTDIAAQYTYTQVDPQLEQLPEHIFSIWGRTGFALGGIDGFGAGLGMRHFGGYRDGAAPETPAVTLFDGMLAYEEGRWRYALTVQNITDRVYVSACLSRGDCFYGARRTAIFSARYHF
jgi:iron complex outermembrane receptor protein